jgi:homogentisate phytyltransferase / homogentisate geranylgeranyltransferase
MVAPAVSSASLPLARRASPLVLWRFGRPHTLIGTALGVLGIAAIASAELPGFAVGDELVNIGWTLLAALAVNIYIVGLNQLEDVELDRINKPWLPVAAGELSPSDGRRIVAVCGLLPVVLALTQGWIELVSVLLALLVGTAYSSPPLRLKRFPTLAAVSIAGVRALVVNIGVYAHFSGTLHGIPGPVWALTLFVAPFSLAIAVLKDVPDAEGDRRFSIATFTVRLGPRPVLRIALGALTAAYLGMAVVGPLALPSAQPVVLAATHVAALALLWAWRSRVVPEEPASVARFYMRVWVLFFLEYVTVPVAVLAA